MSSKRAEKFTDFLSVAAPAVLMPLFATLIIFLAVGPVFYYLEKWSSYWREKKVVPAVDLTPRYTVQEIEEIERELVRLYEEANNNE